MTLTYIIDISVCWTLLYLIFHILLKKATYYHTNRWYLLGSLMLGLLLPLCRYIDLDIYKEDVVQVAPLLYYISEAPTQTIQSVIEQSREISSQLTIINLLYTLYAAGVLFFLVRFLKGLKAIFKLLTEGTKLKKEGYTLVKTTKPHLPFSFLRYVFISDVTKLDQDYDRILRHELAHVKCRHSLDILFIEMITIFFWFHPIVYFYKTAVRQTHEFIADAAVLTTVSRKEYGRLLLAQATSGLQLSLTHHFFHSHIKNRITMMYRKKSGPSVLFKYFLILPVLLLLITAFAQTTDNDQEVTESTSVPIPEQLKGIIVYSDDEGANIVKMFQGQGHAPNFENLVELTYGKIEPIRFEDKKGRQIQMDPMIQYYNSEERTLARNGLLYDRDLLKRELDEIMSVAREQGSSYVQQRMNLVYRLFAYENEEEEELISNYFHQYAAQSGLELNIDRGRVAEVFFKHIEIPIFPKRYNQKKYSDEIAFSEIDDFIQGVGGELATGIHHSLLRIRYHLLLEKYPNHQWDIMEIFNKYMRDRFGSIEFFLPRMKPQVNVMASKTLLQYIDETDPDKAPYVWVEGGINDLPLSNNVDFTKPIGKYLYMPPEKAIRLFGAKGKYGFYALYEVERPHHHPEKAKKRVKREIKNFFSTLRNQDENLWSHSLKKFYESIKKRYNTYNTDQHNYIGDPLTAVSNEAILHDMMIVFRDGEIKKVYKSLGEEYVRID